MHTNTSTKHWTEVADEPVWVSWAEAGAFCAANGARLMTEPEYGRLLDQSATVNKGFRSVFGSSLCLPACFEPLSDGFGPLSL